MSTTKDLGSATGAIVIVASISQQSQRSYGHTVEEASQAETRMVGELTVWDGILWLGSAA
jgi:hypothetical protein